MLQPSNSTVPNSSGEIPSFRLRHRPWAAYLGGMPSLRGLAPSSIPPHEGGSCERIRIVGASGVGKTALAETIAAEAAADGWLVARAPSFRIHASLSLFAARRVVQSLLDALGESAGRYSSGLTIDRERPEDFQEAFLRIIEGVTLDHRLLLVLDDAQWADPESRDADRAHGDALADRAILVLSTERSRRTRSRRLRSTIRRSRSTIFRSMRRSRSFARSIPV